MIIKTDWVTKHPEAPHWSFEISAKDLASQFTAEDWGELYKIWQEIDEPKPTQEKDPFQWCECDKPIPPLRNTKEKGCRICGKPILEPKKGFTLPKLTPCPACGDLHKEPIEPKVINEKAQISNQQVIKPEPLKIEELKEFHLKDFEKCKIDQATINSLLELKINELIRIIKQLNKG